MNCRCGHSVAHHRTRHAIPSCFSAGCECRWFDPDGDIPKPRRYGPAARMMGSLDPYRPAYIPPHFSVLSIEPKGPWVGFDRVTLAKPMRGEHDLMRFVVACYEVPVEIRVVVRVHISRDCYESCPRTFYWWGGDFLDAAQRVTRQSIGGASETHFGITALHEQIAPHHELAKTKRAQLDLRLHQGWCYYGITTGKGRPAAKFPPQNLAPFVIPGLRKPKPPSRR